MAPEVRNMLGPVQQIAITLAALILLTVAAPAKAELQMTTAVASRTFTFTGAGASHDIDYCGNGRIASSTSVQRVVVVIHGDQRNACDYAHWTVAAARRAGALPKTLVVAPDFVTSSEVREGDRRRPYWTDDGWKDGSLSRISPHRRSARVSSFAVVDAMLTRLRASLPGVPIVIAGHSAGGQFANRYAATGRVGADRYVVANPSSYLYFDRTRFIDGRFRTPSEDIREDCSGYNEYKYGLDDPYAYVSGTSVAIKDRYAARRVTYLLGERDTSREGALDSSCEADLQGRNRLERGKRYHAHLIAVLGPSAMGRHRLTIVPDIGHDGRAMLSSDAARAAVFG